MVGAFAAATAASRGGQAVGFLLPGDGSSAKVCVIGGTHRPYSLLPSCLPGSILNRLFREFNQLFLVVPHRPRRAVLDLLL